MSDDRAFLRHLILVRHGTREACWDRAERDHALRGWDAAPPKPFSQFQKAGRYATYALAGRLADELEARDIKVDTIVHGSHLVTRQTARIYADVLADRNLLLSGGAESALVQHATLDPDCREDATLDSRCRVDCAFSKAGSPRNRPCKRLECVHKQILRWREPEPRRQVACLLVGHQPDLTEIAQRFASIPSGILPIGSAETACIELARPQSGLFAAWREKRAGRQRWLLTSCPEQLLTDVHGKIASKFDVAKFFLGALVVNGGLLINANLWSLDGVALALVCLGYLCLLLSLGLTVGTLFAYDQLLMPTAFWGADRDGDPRPWSVARPPSQAQIVLYYEMIHVWAWLFQPAAVFAIAALLLFLCALAQASLADHLGSALNAYMVTALLGLGALVAAAVVYHLNRPNLGTQD